MIKFTPKQRKIACILIEEIENWESTEKVSTKEFMKLVRKLSKLKHYKVGMLRQWLNEEKIDDPEKMVTNEDIEFWL